MIEAVFTSVGGFLDAYAYLAHGHVFANAQTGNVVLLAVASMTGDWAQAGRHIPPIAACALGVSAAKLLGVQKQKVTYRATLMCQAIELAVLILLLFCGHLMPQWLIVPTLSFVAALQITSFDMLGPFRFNSAMTTGNLKSVVSGITAALLGEDTSANWAGVSVSAVACVSFLFGALFGAFWTRRHPVHALFPCVLLVLVGLALTWHEHVSAFRSDLRSTSVKG